MSEPKPVYKHGGKRRGAGRPAIETQPGESTKELTIRIDTSQHGYLVLSAKREDLSIAAYVRRLIKQDIIKNRALTHLAAEQVEYLVKEYGGVIAGVAKLIERDRAEM